MLFRKAAVLLTILLVLATFGVAVWFWKNENRLFSSPTIVRTNQTYLRAHAPATNMPPIETNLYSQFHIDRDTNRIQISFPDAQRGRIEVDFAPLEIHRADASQTIQIGEGSIRLAYIGTVYAQPRTNFDYGLQLPATYYTVGATPISTNDLPKSFPKYQRTLSFDGTFPASQFVFLTTNIAELKTLRFGAFDATTHYSLANGYSYGEFTNGFYCGSSLHLWHQTPIELIATVATGPIQSYSIAPTEGAELRYPGGQIRLLLITDQDLSSWSSSSDGRSNIVTFKQRHIPGWRPPGLQTSFVFHSWPKAYSIGVDFEFLDHSGKSLHSYRSGSSGHLLTSSIQGRLEDVKEIRLKHYPNTHRLIYTIPEMPGLPAQNRNIKNLFDVHIPYIYLRYEHDFQYGLGHLLQMDQHHFALTYPNGYFPSIRTSTSPRELFPELESMLANKETHLVADPRKNEIRTRVHPVRAAVDAVKKKLGM